jgi:hypothetical protein
MAKDAGVTAVWARSGTQYAPEHWPYLVKVTHWTDEDVRREKGLKSRYGGVTPDYAIDSLAELREISCSADTVGATLKRALHFNRSHAATKCVRLQF